MTKTALLCARSSQRLAAPGALIFFCYVKFHNNTRFAIGVITGINLFNGKAKLLIQSNYSLITLAHIRDNPREAPLLGVFDLPCFHLIAKTSTLGVGPYTGAQDI